MLTQFQRVRFNIVLLQLHPFVLLFDPSVWCPLDVVAATTSSTTRGFPLDLLQDPRCQLAACTKSAGSQKDPGCCAISTDAGCLTDYEYRSGFSSCGFGDVSASFRSTCCIWKDDPRKNGTDWSWTPPPVVTKENDPMPLAPNQTGVPDEVRFTRLTTSIQPAERCFPALCQEHVKGKLDLDCCAVPREAFCGPKSRYEAGSFGCGELRRSPDKRSTCCIGDENFPTGDDGIRRHPNGLNVFHPHDNSNPPGTTPDRPELGYTGDMGYRVKPVGWAPPPSEEGEGDTRARERRGNNTFVLLGLGMSPTNGSRTNISNHSSGLGGGPQLPSWNPQSENSTNNATNRTNRGNQSSQSGHGQSSTSLQDARSGTEQESSVESRTPPGAELAIVVLVSACVFLLLLGVFVVVSHFVVDRGRWKGSVLVRVWNYNSAKNRVPVGKVIIAPEQEQHLGVLRIDVEQDRPRQQLSGVAPPRRGPPRPSPVGSPQHVHKSTAGPPEIQIRRDHPPSPSRSRDHPPTPSPLGLGPSRTSSSHSLSPLHKSMRAGKTSPSTTTGVKVNEDHKPTIRAGVSSSTKSLGTTMGGRGTDALEGATTTPKSGRPQSYRTRSSDRLQ